MHLAAAVDVHVIGVFGVADPQRTRPWSAKGHTLGDAQGWPTAAAVMEQVAHFL